VLQPNVALVGGDCNVAPLWLAAQELRAGATVHAIIGARSSGALCGPFRRAAAQASAGRLELHLTTEDGVGLHGRVTLASW
jgi:NAD(P)H-flavin reductase